MDHDAPTRGTVRSICRRQLDLTPFISSVCDAYVDRFEALGILLEIDVPPYLWVYLDPILIREVLHKLLDNAMEAMSAGGVLTITVLVGRQGLEIEVADSGPGIAAELQGKVFEPFVTGKKDHAGLGLSMVRDIACAHEGSVTATDCPDGGAAFTVLLPSWSARLAA